jgi:hypothetical protein
MLLPSSALLMEGVLILSKVRRAIFFTTGELAGDVGFTGVCGV